MATSLYSGVSGLAIGAGLYKTVSGLWGGASGLVSGFGGGFSPLSLFASGEQGAWYDPSDFSTLFQDSAGTTPVTATGQTVGLLLDKSKGLVLGPELVTNGTFDTDTGWTKETGWSISGGRANSSAVSGFGAILQSKPELVEGRAYRVSFEITSYTSGTVSLAVGANGGVAINSGNKNAVGVYTFVGTFPVGATKQVYARQENGFVGSIDNVSVRELPGNHATQSVLASRPIYGIEPFGGRRNLLTYTEQFDNAAWNKITTTVTPNSDTAPDGTTTADTLAATGANSLVYQVVAGLTNSTTYTLSVWVKTAGSGATATLAFYTAGGGTTIGSQSFTTTGSWQRVTLTATTGTLSGETWFAIGGANTFTTGESLFIWGAQLEAASTATAYQRVTDQWNVTQAGVPSLSYLQFDGSDDWLVSPTITPGIDKAQVFAGVRKLSDAAVGIIVESSTDVGTNAGSISLTSRNAPAYALQSRGSVSPGNATTPSSYTAPITNVLTAIGDIAGDNSTVRVNGAQVVQNVGDQGTGNYLAYPLYVGRRGGTSLPFNGRVYSLIVRFGANLSAATITQTENWVAGKTGIYTVEQLIRLNTQTADGTLYSAYAASDAESNNYLVNNTVLAADGTSYNVI